jgi:SAM-dependent methyltransferase
MPDPGLLPSVAAYYNAKLAAHGQTPHGVDWNGAEGQAQRFAQLLRVVHTGAPFSINDVGCGYGALVDFLDGRGDAYAYRGYDVAEAMVHAARARYAGRDGIDFVIGDALQPADYSVASGIFNVRLDADPPAWELHVLRVLDAMNAASRHGYAFNCLTSYSDAERMQAYLHYADPCRLFDHCMRRHSRHVALLHDYGLYEFTILVRK